MSISSPGGRAIPPAGSQLRPGQRILRIAVIGVFALLLPLAAYALREATLSPESEEPAVDGKIGEIAGPDADAVLQALTLDPPSPPVLESDPDIEALLALLPPPEPALPPEPDPEQLALEEALERKGESDILVFRSEQSEAPIAALVGDASALTGESVGTALGRQLTPTEFRPGRAERLEDISARLLQGTLIGCVLETAVSSSVPGLAACRTRLPVYSADGSYELIAPGTRILGEYQGGLQNGQSRIFVLWNRLVTPDGIAVSLASPGAGPLGRGGHSGDVDRKWGDRIAAAFMVSLIADAAEQGTEGRFPSTREALIAAATEVVRTELAVQSELTKNQGERITIVVARDVDFREALDLRFEQAGRESDPLLFSD